MLTGVDTGFFYALAAAHPEATSAWECGNLLTSSLCLFELQRKMLKGGFRGWPDLLREIEKAVAVIPVTSEIALHGGQISYGTGMPAFDSIILSSFVLSECDEVLTADNHFLKFKKKGMKIRLLSLT